MYKAIQVEVNLMTCLRRHREEVEVQLQPPTSALEGDRWQHHAPAFSHQERRSTYCTLGWVGTGAGLDERDSNPGPSSP